MAALILAPVEAVANFSKSRYLSAPPKIQIIGYLPKEPNYLSVYPVKGLYKTFYASTLSRHDQPVTLADTQVGLGRHDPTDDHILHSDTGRSPW